MNEEFLYYIWQNRLLLSSNLKLTSGQEIEILNPGFRNYESGPDFFNARIRTDGIVWAGNVEIHVKASDWYKHHHTGDLSYDNIILHAVQIADTEIFRIDGSPLPTLIMNGNYPPEYLNHYLDLIQGGTPFIPCSRALPVIHELQKSLWLDRVLAERLESRFKELATIYQQCDKRWPNSFYRVLSKAFGFKVNSTPFEVLAKSVPYELLLRHRQVPEELESIFFGQAGLLPPTSGDPYAERLKRHYRFYKHKYHLSAMSPHIWKFGGLRPANFPTIRISQFAMLHFGQDHLLDRVLSAIEPEELTEILDISASDYWYHHYRFGMTSTPYTKRLGKESVYNLIINAIVPFLFFYGKTQHLPILCDKAVYWMEHCPPENNRIIRSWQDVGWYASHAGDTQALLHLKKNYCDFKKCVNCGIGQQLLNQSCKTS